MFGTIVVGVDGSGGAGRAVQTVAKIAVDTKDQVVVCHGTAVHHAWGKDLPSETTDETQQLVDRYVSQLTAAGVPATGEVRQELDKGMGDALINVAMSHQAGLIVLGTRAARTSSRRCWAAWRTMSCANPRCRYSWCRTRPASGPVRDHLTLLAEPPRVRERFTDAATSDVRPGHRGSDQWGLPRHMRGRAGRPLKAGPGDGRS